LSDDEKIAMTAVLSLIYNRENTSGANQDIALELKKLAADPNKQIAHDAATHYAGLEYLPGTEHVLQQALKNGALDTDSYFREIAHLITSAPPDKQKEFMAEIRASSNRLASDILADALDSGKDFNAAPFLKSSEDMAELLRNTEPQFGRAVGQYGGTDALRYETWLRASATIESAKTGRSMDDIIVAKLSEPGTDPRKVMAYLSSPYAAALLAEAAPDSQVEKLAAIARRQSDQNPGNRDMRFLAEQIEAQMKPEYRANLAMAESRINEQNPLRSYQPTPGIPGRIVLEEMRASGIPATPLSATLALGLSRSGRLSDEERIAMTAILFALHNPENTSGANQDIALELKSLAADSNEQVSAYAAMDYARLGYQPDTKQVLDQALQSGALPADAYFREIAHLIPSAPLKQQKEFMAEVLASSNRLASDILADALNSRKDFNAAPFLRSSEDMAELLRNTEPQFGGAVGQYGGTDALRYETWLRASATIESARTGRNMDEIIVAKLSEPGTDPRKVSAYLSSWEAMPLLAEAAPGSQVQKLAASARRHSDQNPGNSYMRFLAETIEVRMKHPPPAAPKPAFTVPGGPAVPPDEASMNETDSYTGSPQIRETRA
jgi:hypothetical protein